MQSRQSAAAFHTKIQQCCLPITTGWLTMGGRGKATKQTNPKSELETKDAKGTGLLTAGKRRYRTLQTQWQCFTHFTCKFHFLMSSLTKPDFSLVYPLPSTQEGKQKLASFTHKHPQTSTSVFFQGTSFKITFSWQEYDQEAYAFHQQTDEWGINTKIKLVILHVSSPHLWRVTSSGPWLRVVQAHRTLWKSKNSGFAVRWLEKGSSCQHFPCFLPLFPLLHLEAAFFPFHISSKNMQSDLVCKNVNIVI